MAFILKVVFFIFISTFSVLSSTNENQEYRITVLATNISNYGGIGEWSFAALYESNEESLLFDTGFDKNTVLHNAQLLKKDLSKVEKVVLSHFHSDHTGGLLQLRKTYKQINPKALSKVYVAKGFFEQRYLGNGEMVGPGDYADAKEFLNAAKSEGIEFIIVDDALEVAPNLFATGPVERVVEKFNGPQGIFIKDERSGKYTLDIIHDDQSLGYKTNQGWVMMSGCGHSGVINTGKKLQTIENLPIYGMIGGFHLWQSDDETLNFTANWLKNNGLTKFMGGHCTGIQAAITMSEIIGIEKNNLSHTAVGSVLTKGFKILRSSVE